MIDSQVSALTLSNGFPPQEKDGGPQPTCFPRRSTNSIRHTSDRIFIFE